MSCIQARREGGQLVLLAEHRFSQFHTLRNPKNNSDKYNKDIYKTSHLSSMCTSFTLALKVYAQFPERVVLFVTHWLFIVPFVSIIVILLSNVMPNTMDIQNHLTIESY